jgi:hypothetical protein
MANIYQEPQVKGSQLHLSEQKRRQNDIEIFSSAGSSESKGPGAYLDTTSNEITSSRKNSAAFCIEMGKAKPKILKNSFNSAYHVFMPSNGAGRSRLTTRIQDSDASKGEGGCAVKPSVIRSEEKQRTGSSINQRGFYS